MCRRAERAHGLHYLLVPAWWISSGVHGLLLLANVQAAKDESKVVGVAPTIMRRFFFKSSFVDFRYPKRIDFLVYRGLTRPDFSALVK